MKILLVHNHYGSEAPSGENEVFKMEKELLQFHGHEVLTFEVFSDHIRKKPIMGRILGALSTPWNPFSAKRIQRLIEKFSPDVIHAHNTFPLLSPSIFRSSNSVARVLTLHNYRLFCPSAIPMRNGNVCTLCLSKKSVIPALKYGCYRNSRIATFPLAVNVELNRSLGTWQNHVDAFITLSEFQRNTMIEAGLPNHKVYVKPNFYPGSPLYIDYKKRNDYIVFVGRVSQEKGVATLVEAWKLWGNNAPELRIIGDGPLRKELETNSRGFNIKFLGQLTSFDAQKQIQNSKLLILPSEWFEGFPMVIREAFAFGTPVAASNIGPIPDIVKEGVNGNLFEAGNANSIYLVVSKMVSNNEYLSRLSLNARRSFEKFYDQESNYKSLMNIYSKAMGLKMDIE